ncbi:MAG: WD40 repeat domain-containing protein, partial [Bacteroidetes bacterium]|nr:WD40 repeat domain-containing protein [Bacteroidota bacterium]
MYKFLLSAITLLLISKIYSQPVSLTIPSGHAKAIEKIAVSSNGKYVASIAYKTVIVWDMASRKKIHEVNLDISLTASEASTLSITANADKLVASTNSGLFCYDIATGKQLFKNGSATSGAAFSADGSKVYAIDYGTLYIYKATDGNTIKYISGVVKNTSEDCIFFELGTNRLLILHHNGWSIVNTETDEIVVNNTFKDIYREKLSSYAYIQSKGIIAGIREDSLLLFDAFKTSVIKAKKLAGEPDGICVTDKGDIVTFRQDYKAGMFKTEIYDGGSLSVTHTSSQPQSDVPEAIFYGNNCIQLPGKDKIVFNNNLQLWAYDIENASYTNLFQNKITDFKAFYYYKNLSQRIAADNSLVFSTEDNGIRSFSMKTFSPDSFVAASPHIIYSSDGILAAGIDKKITITNRQTGKVVKTISLPAGVDHETEFFFFSYDNKKIIYTNREKGLLNALDINTGIPGSILSVGGSFYECSSSFDGKYFACKAGSSLKIFNLQTKQSVFNKKACDPANPDECINDFKFLNDSYYLFVEKNKDNVSIYKADDATYNSSFKIQHYNKFSVLGGDIKNNIIAIGEVGQFQVGTYNLKLITKEGKLIREFLSENNNDFLKAAFSNDDKIMFTPTTQKGVQVWDTETGELLGTYYFVEKTNEYIFVSPEGLFDGSVEGMKELYFVKNNQPIPLEKLYEQFYVPGLLQRKIHGEKFLPPDVASLHAPPKVVISYAEKQRNLELDNDVPSYQNTTGLAEITVTASTEDDAIDEIRLFLNGKVLNLATRNLIVEDDKSKTATKKYS